MFKTEGEFSGLDQFYHTDTPNHMLSKDSIAERTNEIVALYKDWELLRWKFSENEEDRNEIQQDCIDVVDLMRDAANTYSLGMFIATIQLSSAAVERLINTILFIEKKICLKLERDANNQILQSPLSDWNVVKTVLGPRYYTDGFNSRVYKDGKGFKIFHLRYLSPSIDELEECNSSYGVKALCEGNSSQNCIFVERRNAAAHGITTRLNLIEQAHGYVVQKAEDWYPLINNKFSGFSQYRLASDFVVNAFSVFTRKFGYYS